MDIEINNTTPLLETAPAPAARVAPVVLTKSQIKSAALADALAVKVKWKTLIKPANASWNKLHPEELVRVEGNFHKLAGLVQLRYALSRQEADRQVTEFFAVHYPAA